MPKVVKIAITGPESTGKSMISEQLADHYHTVWVNEYARFYLKKVDRPYHFHDILEIAKGQKSSEEVMVRLANRVLFSDTELLVTKIWCEVKYGKCHEWISQNFENQHYDLYLLMFPDIPWLYDPMREHPDKRDWLFELYHENLIKKQANYRIVNGLGEVRLKNAISFVDELLSSQQNI